MEIDEQITKNSAGGVADPLHCRVMSGNRKEGFMDMIKLTTPEGKIYIARHEVIALAQSSQQGLRRIVKTKLWLRGQEEPYNIPEEIDDVLKLLA